MTTRTVLALTCLVGVLLSGCTTSVDGDAVAGPTQPGAEQSVPDASGTTGPAEPPPTAPTGGPAPRLEEIAGIKHIEYPLGQHVKAPGRVAYDQSPPFGGAHDYVWAACNGVVYEKAVRTEHMVHSLEHGAVWIAYNPDKVQSGDVETLAGKVRNKPYTMMSPYPGLDRPISIQAWGYQVKVDKSTDERIDRFITAVRRNPDTSPEPGAPCDISPAAGFDQDNPPPFDPSPPGDDAVPAN